MLKVKANTVCGAYTVFGKRSNTCYSAPLQASPTAEALRYMARTEQRRTYLPYTFPAVAGILLIYRPRRVE